MATAKIDRLIAKKERLYSRMNELYRSSLKISEFSSRKNDDFIVMSQLIDEMKTQFESLIDEINECQVQLDPTFKADYQSLSSFEDLYLKVRNVRNLIIQAAPKPISSNDNNSSKSRCDIILPAIELPFFDGKMENWPRFYDSFRSNIHENSRLNDSQRIQYLMSKLTHGAIKLTVGIVPSGETYPILWKSLVKKYQDVRMLGNHYLKNILDAKNCTNTANSLDSFIENYTASVLALKQLNFSDLSDFILLHCALRRLDSQTILAFESSVRNVEVPTYTMLTDFVRDHVKVLERSSADGKHVCRSNVDKPVLGGTVRNVHKSFVVSSNSNEYTRIKHCVFCDKGDHFIYNCLQFKNLDSPIARFEFIKSKNGCVNCLGLTHTVNSCSSKSVCKLCQKSHHTLLHFPNNVKKYNKNTYKGRSAQTTESSHKQSNSTIAETNTVGLRACEREATSEAPLALHSANQVSSHNNNTKVSSNIVLLSTVQVYANQKNTNNKIIIRCLLDNGSQSNLISLECCKILNLHITPINQSYLHGIGLEKCPIRGFVNLDIESRIYPGNNFSIRAFVVDRITDQLPSQYIPMCNMEHLAGIPLADTNWNIPSNVDVVLGAQLFPFIYLGNKVQSDAKIPLALSTVFGYVLMGDCPTNAQHAPIRDEVVLQNTTSAFSFSAMALNDLMQRFWELEELPTKKHLSPEELECENMYVSSVTRVKDGRYQVSLPFNKNPNELGNSRTVALRRYMALERRFRQSPGLRENYNMVIKDYIEKGFLSEVTESDFPLEGYFIPHHAVTRADKPMPRIVLDASSKTHTGLSLNDILYTGQNLQADLFLLLLHFRLFPVAMTADIRQMYLQLSVPVDQRKYLRILFRFANDESIRAFQFNRLPFGLRSSPYLAMRTVRQLAEDMRPQFPNAAKIAESSLFMDDLVYSSPDEATATSISKELILLFKSGAFDLVKWTSNSVVLLESLPDSHRCPIDFSDNCNNSSKVLGLSWQPADDSFFFTTVCFEGKCTKRNILSVVARLFDVLGFVAPVILYAKLLIKELWLCNIGWDDEPPGIIIQKFTSLVREFPLLSTLKIPRHSGVSNNCTVLIVAFCDASMGGYGCVIYLHVTDSVGNVMAKLLCAKSKVSPTKITTLARLELCAALLMAKLCKTVMDTYLSRLPIAGTYAFSDSRIALSWIHSSPHRWSIFVSNRVAQCHEHLKPENFYHISGVENPSDCLSRGMLPSRLISHELWWNGPQWMQQPLTAWQVVPFTPVKIDEMPEHKLNVLINNTKNETCVLSLLSGRVSSWNKLLRIVTYILQFAKKLTRDSSSVQKIMMAEKYVIVSVQNNYFSEDIALLKQGKLPSKRLKNLSAFLDEDNILRIGGRLRHSSLPFEAKHPALLPKHDRIVDLIINHYHVMNCHTGPGLLLSILRQKYWILDARTVVRAIVRRCNSCFRVNPSHPQPKMADLPSYRVSEAKAFVHTGVDYAGPIKITLTRRRGQRTQKAYICLFVCLATKAVHIELVSDLTSNAFLAAFSRFISRRGPVSCLYSDNGTNFIGAKAQLDELYSFLLRSEFNPLLKRELTDRRIEWKMIPPRSPHFGGMWESNIKSLKSHLYRVIGSQILTYEELLTILVQIECIMNSRPLIATFADHEPDIITPAHFLMSTPLQYLPAQDLTDARISLTDRKQLLDSMVQSFWKKWRLEYLHTLQVRQKWASLDHPVTVGTVVLVGQDDSHPLVWPLGVITEVHPGLDKIIRVATVKTKYGTFKRPVVKLYPIPTQ